MKFILTFKTPNALDQSIVDSLPEAEGLDQEEQDKLWYEVETLAEKFVEYKEYITIEFDTKTGTATVIPLKRR